MNQEVVRLGIDVGHAIVMAFEMQPAGRDDAFQAFQRRCEPPVPGEIPGGLSRRLTSLMRRGHAVGGEGLARRGHCRGDEIVGPCGRSGGCNTCAGQSGFEKFAAGRGGFVCHARDFGIAVALFQAAPWLHSEAKNFHQVP